MAGIRIRGQQHDRALRDVLELCWASTCSFFLALFMVPSEMKAGAPENSFRLGELLPLHRRWTLRGMSKVEARGSRKSTRTLSFFQIIRTAGDKSAPAKPIRPIGGLPKAA